ncbi:hypothetical protein HN873_040706 [Arachis hypogaea]
MEERSERGDASPVGCGPPSRRRRAGGRSRRRHASPSKPHVAAAAAGGSSPPFSCPIAVVYLPSSPNRCTRKPTKRSPPLRHASPPTCLEAAVADQI